MKLHKESHLDHGLNQKQIDYLVSLFSDRDSFFIETVVLPDELGTVPCGLYGPIMGDEPMTSANHGVFMETRGNRSYKSRCVDRPTRPTNQVTVIAGPHEGEACILYTAFGGPSTPQEPDDPGCKDRDKSLEFWSEHALAV